MLEKLSSLKSTNKILYYAILGLLALPVIGLIVVSVVSPAIRAFLVYSAKKLMDKTEAKDKEIQAEIKEVQKEINTIDAKLDVVDTKLEEVKNDDDANWHKKGKK